MNILYTSSLYPPSVGGAQIHLHRLAVEVRRMGHDARVVTNARRNRRDWVRLASFRADRADVDEHDGVPIQTLGYRPATRVAMIPWASTYYAQVERSAARLADLIRPELDHAAGRPDVVHATRIGREFLTRASLDLARRRDIPFILTPNHHPRWHGRRYRAFDRIYREADAVIALTDAERDLLIQTKGVRPERIHVTGIAPILADASGSAATGREGAAAAGVGRGSPRLGEWAEEFRQRFDIADPFVLFLGQQLPYKGVDALLAAAPRVWRAHPDTRLVFIGPTTGYSRKLFRAVDDRRVINLGPVDLATKTSALAACEMLCLPSSQESFGGVFTEAWSMGKPVIGGRIPAIACVIDEGHDGLLCRQDPVELADAVNHLLANPATAEAMGRAGHAKVQERYTQERLAQRTLDVYRSAMGTVPVGA
jgi:glycosyltransferase involved in cell wall biosynthesis